MKLTAHRGVSSLAPENTLAAFEQASLLDVEWIEIDVQLSQDKVPVVIHDRTVNRCTNGSGRVADLSVQALKSLDAGLWFGDAYQGETIPTLAETLLLAHRHGLTVNIELKHYEGDDIELLCEQVKMVMTELNVASQHVLFSSFCTQALQTMQRIMPTIRRGQLWQQIPADALSLLSDLDAYSVHCDYRFLDEKTARWIKSSGYQLYCYTPNHPELVEPLWGWGVDMMISDAPQDYLSQSSTQRTQEPVEA
ncbi:glycerophosphoryl diester phosphodiesterase [Vibrio sp. 10N]|uniref:glycerophosphoryl diester phosphodiesterase n=1 Tax=Vibrio sp. 10N TaxID=3058938 RepID=UPI002813ABC7|nr:glycerophosphoryl diester phosphodiesterase [Vibrio sp. 10N]